eukprot:gene9109-6664_t
MALGDAIGAPLEFMPAVDEPGAGAAAFDLAARAYTGAPRNMFGVKPGQWTDDASMGLCIADSLIAHGRFDGSDVNARLWCWNHRGYNNAFGHDAARLGDEATRRFMADAGLDATASLQSVGCGKGMAQALRAFDEGRPPPAECPAGVPAQDGNGALIRLAPVPVFCAARATECCVAAARASCRTTHLGAEAGEAAACVAFLMHRAITRADDSAPLPVWLDAVAR